MLTRNRMVSIFKYNTANNVQYKHAGVILLNALYMLSFLPDQSSRGHMWNTRWSDPLFLFFLMKNVVENPNLYKQVIVNSIK